MVISLQLVLQHQHHSQVLLTLAQPNVTSLGTLTGLTVSGDVNISDKIFHTGDSDTAIRFPANDIITTADWRNREIKS